MVSWDDYQKMTEKQWKTLKLVTTQELRNGLMILPKGTCVRVDRKYQGLHITSEPCPCCGIKVRMSRVSPTDVRVIV